MRGAKARGRQAPRMSFLRALMTGYLAGRRAAVAAARKTERTIRLLRTIQVLLSSALLVIVATAAVALLRPDWAGYAYALGSVLLAIPLVAVLVLVWKPLHSRTMRRVERAARRLGRA